MDATISDATTIGETVIDETFLRILGGYESWSSGLGEIPCTTGEEGLFEYDYARTAEVSDPTIRSKLMDQIWDLWQSEYGLESGEGLSEPPDLVAFGEGFTVSMFGSARPGRIEVSFHTDSCLPR